ncbi:MAG: 16S rRNA (guanine(966)-N(2))-methyltransferase RsmD [Pseudomonadota bacterium]
MTKKTAAKPAKTPVHAQTRHAQQVRIIGGQWKRTPLAVVNAEGLRPTPDRVREATFNWINHLIDGAWDGLAVLDLFAGTGAMGFEAASRGAASVVLVDTHTPAITQLELVKAKLGADQVSLFRADAVTVAQSMAARGQCFDLIFLDPPYQQDWLMRTLPLCLPLLKAGGLVYAESGAALAAAQDDGGTTPAWLAAWDIVRQDKAGQVFYHLLQRKQSN